MNTVRRWRRRVGYFGLALVLVVTPLYYWLFVESHVPSKGSYGIDIAEVRRLADSLPGDGPTEIRVETVARLSFPRAIVVAGDRWGAVDIPVSSYQPVYAGRTVIIDTAFDQATAKGTGAVFKSYDPEAYERMSAALQTASLIVITHEHMDHIGGLIAQSGLRKVLTVTRLTKEQVDNADRMAPVKWPAGALDGYEPLQYDKYAAVAPGVVLIKAPGHTPGSQMVYVKRADGAEVLFLGDVAWQLRNVDEQRERPRAMTWLMLKEDRDAVMLELAALERLREAEPRIEMMPGHDAVVLDRLVGNGLLIKGFK